MTEAVAVSIVTVFHNRVDAVLDSVNSLLNQTFCDFEIIFVDDGSTDNTLQIIRQVRDPRLKVISQSNMGFTRAIASAVSISRGRYVAVHGAGDLSSPKRIERQFQVMEADAKIGIVGCYVENEKNDSSELVLIKSSDHEPLRNKLKTENPFTHGEVMFRRSVYDLVGGYRPIFSYAQDRDLWLRMSRHTSYHIIQECLYRRRKFTSSISKDPMKLLQQYIFSDLAVQCAISVDANGPDIVAKYGHAAFMLRRPSRPLANRLARLSLRLLSIGQTGDVPTLNRIAYGESITKSVLIACALGHVAKWRVIWEPIVRPALVRRLSRSPSLHWGSDTMR